MAAKLIGGRVVGGGGEGRSRRSFCRELLKRRQPRLPQFTVSASASMDAYKQLGMFSLKRKIEDAVLKAEMMAPTALELEEEQWMRQEEMMRDCDLWDDPSKSNDILLKLADTAKTVDALKDLKFKAEEAKLITELAEMNAIDYGLFEQAYDSCLDVSKSLHHYEMSKLLKDGYDMEGAFMIINAGSEDADSQIWVEQLVRMYTKWAEKLGREARRASLDKSEGFVSSASIEFEFEYAYGYLSGEQGIHRLITSSRNGFSSTSDEACATVEVIPLFLRTSPDLKVNDEDLVVSYSSSENTVWIKHLPTGISVESSGERSRFANKIKALNRLKAKLLVTGSKNVLEESRRYTSRPRKMVLDMKTGVEVSNMNSVLDGNIRPFIAAHVGMRQNS
ncbi:PREDICTED: peptide chain release factor PrfB3, chloroplastic-like [Tarenaya hassleriana]|uniref:peptide chain release factor PrfB3, chloroplastic-like n=1 Tax=Tarenaya hassleriana TaxID=28532 RepID=UPI00053C9094|nr:PREDICTED: peptide chain release factor PrfB3, chloroplastic-like [Tarenaya hassleriana]